MWTFEKIKEKLNSRHIPFEEVAFSDTAVSARMTDTSVNGNYDPRNAVKTLLVKGKAGVFALILRGEDKVDTDKLKELIGKWSVVTAPELETNFGLVAGGINPFVLDVPILLDESVLQLTTLSMGAGSVTQGINIKTDDLIKHLVFKTVKIRKEA